MATQFVPHPQYFQLGTIAHLEDLYRQHRDAMYGAALRVVRNGGDAEDVVQTVFLRMIRNEVLPEAGCNVSAYFRRAATNAAIDMVRKRAQMAETELPVSHPGPRETAEGVRYVRQVLGKLPPQSAELFEMHSRGYQYDELARRFGIEIGTVRSRLHRIRAALQRELQVA